MTSPSILLMKNHFTRTKTWRIATFELFNTSASDENSGFVNGDVAADFESPASHHLNDVIRRRAGHVTSRPAAFTSEVVVGGTTHTDENINAKLMQQQK